MQKNNADIPPEPDAARCAVLSQWNQQSRSEEAALAQPWEKGVGRVMLLQQRRADGMDRPGGGQLCPGTSKSVWGW